MPHLSHFFADHFGMSFQDYLLHLRCEKAREFLLTDMSLMEVSLVCGFSAPRYLNAGFRRIYGMTPKEYRARNTGKKHLGSPCEQPELDEVGIGLVRHSLEAYLALIDNL